MNIWVDADACPAIIKDILYRAAQRKKVKTILVANQPLKTPPSPYIRTLVVGAGFDVADNEIIKQMQAGDLVITADIPLASEVIDNRGHALNPRGEFYTSDDIKAKLDMRNFMESMRSSGVHTGGPAKMSQADRKDFADNLDRFLSQNIK